jgi:hypothetical protein
MNIWLKENELAKSTLLGGNVDIDLWIPAVEDAQRSKVEEVLGETLFNKIDVDFGNDDLSGLYLTLFNDYIKPFLIRQSIVEYLLTGAYKVNNNGIFKSQAENAVAVDKTEVDYLVNNYRLKAEMYQGRLERWLMLNQLPEYLSADSQIVPPVYNKSSILNRWYFLDDNNRY